MDHHENCMICGASLRYAADAVMRECAICHRSSMSNCACEEGHFVCDECHSEEALAYLLPFLLNSKEKSPQCLLEDVMALPQVHMHGPEHHAIVPCVLLCAYANCGGSVQLERALIEALRRGKQVVGGSCGYWGACGAAVGAGIYVSIILDSNPLNKDVWTLPQMVVSESLRRNSVLGGPRCCKRTCRTAISTAAQFTTEGLGVKMEDEFILCTYSERNRECLREQCPYFKKENACPSIKLERIWSIRSN